MEAATSEANGTTLRYGAVYGPGTYYAQEGAFTKMICQRRLPVIGAGNGHYSLIHVNDAATATVAALSSEPGTYSIVDDAPVRAGEWLTQAARAVETHPPRRLPRWISAGPLSALRYVIDEQPAVSNQRAKDELGWVPERPSWIPSLVNSMSSDSDGGLAANCGTA